MPVSSDTRTDCRTRDLSQIPLPKPHDLGAIRGENRPKLTVLEPPPATERLGRVISLSKAVAEALTGSWEIKRLSGKPHVPVGIVQHQKTARCDKSKRHVGSGHQ